MMATTHGFMGALLALPLYFWIPEFFFVALLASFAGGVFPDLDLYYGHRKLLHFPVHYNVGWFVVLPSLLLFPSVFTVVMFFFLLSAGVHCYFDRFGGPKDSRPWKYDSGVAVYSHYHEEWWRAEKLVPYDGSWQDFVLLLVASLPTVFILDGDLQWIAIGLVIVSGFYTVFRRKGMEILPDLFFRSVEEGEKK